MPLSSILACPVCCGSLDGVRCTGCGRSYERRGDVLDLTPLPPPDAEVLDRWELWDALQANGESAYTIDAPNNLSVGEREDVRAFARFAQLTGRVLDVGCGPQPLPSYAPRDGEFVGIDPLMGEQPRRFAFVKGIAEYLPFVDACFDRVLFATSIDHVLSPRLAVAEAGRVTRPGGSVVVWLGEPLAPRSPRERAAQAVRWLAHGELRPLARAVRAALPERALGDAMVRVRTAGATMTFKVPDGAVDAFHFTHPDVPTIEQWMGAAGLRIDAIERPLPGHCFIRARR